MPSPGSFADDVERFLCGEVILARPTSSWYRFGKLARRNKVAISAGARRRCAVRGQSSECGRRCGQPGPRLG